MPEHPRQFYKRVKSEEAKLTGDDCYITSVENLEFSEDHKAGCIIAVTRHLAAYYIAKRTHVLSSEAEVQQFHADQKARRAEILKAESDRQPRTILDPEVMAAMTTVATQAAAQSRQMQQPNHQKESR